MGDPREVLAADGRIIDLKLIGARPVTVEFARFDGLIRVITVATVPTEPGRVEIPLLGQTDPRGILGEEETVRPLIHAKLVARRGAVSIPASNKNTLGSTGDVTRPTDRERTAPIHGHRRVDLVPGDGLIHLELAAGKTGGSGQPPAGLDARGGLIVAG